MQYARQFSPSSGTNRCPRVQGKPWRRQGNPDWTAAFQPASQLVSGAGCAKVIRKAGYKVKASDIVDRGYGEVCDFLTIKRADNVVTNAPCAGVLIAVKGDYGLG
jgi:hypothetical protein